MGLIRGHTPREASKGPSETPITKSKASGQKVGFDQFPLIPELQRALTEEGYFEPRPIQVEAIPPALEGRDILGLAATGTGKTAAFVLPVLDYLSSSKRGRGTRTLVVTPTRELAAQVHGEFERLAAYTNIRSVVLFGGVPIQRNIRELRQGADVIVACPGRLIDLLRQREVHLDRVEVLILDEADHMFDMGFLPDIRRILGALPQERQNLMFSATMPREIRKLADRVLVNPVVVELNNSKPAETISHAIYPMREDQKEGALGRLLSHEDADSCIVFVRTKHRARRLAMKLQRRGHQAIALQGNMSQNQRQRALQGFKDGAYDVLVATDIAARGLDISGVTHVINYDVPNVPEAYTHRIGRTGRSESTGTAYTLVTRDDGAQIRAIEKLLGERIDQGDLSSMELPRSARVKRRASGPRHVVKGGAPEQARRRGPAAPRPARGFSPKPLDTPAPKQSTGSAPPGPAFGEGINETKNHGRKPRRRGARRQA